jgi:hypothetical protein
MIDEEEPMAISPSQDKAELLLYDFLKHLTSLSILVLGGVIIVAKDFDPTDVKPGSILIAMAIISFGGICSFSGSSEIVRARNGGTRPKKSLKYLAQAAPALLALGTGYFIALFSDSLI